MKKAVKSIFEDFLISYGFYRDYNNEIKKFDLYSISKWKFRFILFWHGSVLNNIVVEEDKSFIDKALTSRNKDISMSLKQRFKNEKLTIVKIQSKKNDKLISYKLYILVLENNKYTGVKCNIL